MLPSRGFFKKSDCPFFEKGLCVRPHCHFRHRKKVVSENSSNSDSQDVQAGNLSGGQTLSNDEAYKSSNFTPIEEGQHSTNSTRDTESKPDQSKTDSLFAKLVNQSNQYEKISRHIPCAYTPTPQIRGVQPKNKSSGISVISASVKSKKEPVFDGYKTVNYKSNNLVSSEVNENSQDSALNIVPKEQNSTLNSSNNSSKLISERSDCNNFFQKNSDCYEPYSLTKSLCNILGENKSNAYVPSKVNNLTTAESKYEPNISDLLLPCNYVPSKDKQKESEYMPESTGNCNNEITYKPSEKALPKETEYQPGDTNFSADYIPTEKSATKSGNSSWLEGDCGSQLTEIEFVSSEIEMMKAILKEEGSENKTEKDVPLPKTESIENKFNKKSHETKHRSSKSHHSSSSKHRPKSSNDSNSNSSKSKHSSSSNRHNSSSSRHSSCSKNDKSYHKRSLSDSHKKRSSHEKTKHSHESHRSKSKDRGSRRSSSHKSTKEKPYPEKKIEKVKSDSEGSDSVEIWISDQEDSSGKDKNNESENERDLKKRKNSYDDEDRQSKIFKQNTDELFDELEDDPDTVEKQCLEIFNSYSPGRGPDAVHKPNEINLPTEDYENAMQGKKRTAHSHVLTSDHSVLRHKTAKTIRNSIKSAHDVMLERYKTKEKAKEGQTSQAPPPTPPAPIPGLSRPSVKIAAVSNIAQMLQAKKAIQEKLSQGMKVNERPTVAQTVARGGSRVAHTSASKAMTERPTVSAGSKQVPTIKRQIYLDKLLLETNQIYPTKAESAEEALRLEEEVFCANSGSASAYHAAFVSLLFKTRRRVNAVKGGPSKANISKSTVSHFDVLSGGKKNFSILKPKKLDISMLTERHIYEELLRCKLTPEELKENGYPMESGRPGYATCSLNFELKYNDKYTYIKRMTGNRRYCIRCSKEYEVDPISLKQYKEGPETCSYHPEKKKSGGRHSDRIYKCCNSASTEGCATHVRHVTDCNDYENLPNCVKTLSKGYETNPGIFALDCEMVYTRMGYELARVTVVNLKKEIVYDTLVKPKYPIEDYNTLFSGIEEKMMEGVQTTLKDVQAVLLSMFSDKTILIGHSLDSDLRALHLIHGTVVDTAVVYKNEKYHPYKYSLKHLCAKKLCKIIQDNASGHDSAEDAIAALEIMLNHVKEEVSKYDSLQSYESDRA